MGFAEIFQDAGVLQAQGHICGTIRNLSIHRESQTSLLALNPANHHFYIHSCIPGIERDLLQCP